MDSLLKQFAQSSQLGANGAYIEDLYEQYLVAPDSVDAKWRTYFDGLNGREAGDVPHSAVIEHIARAAREARNAGTAPATGADGVDSRQQGAVLKLITAFRSRGHLQADLDPLAYRQFRYHDLDFTNHGLTLWDLDRSFPTGGFSGASSLTLREIL